jgi:hypothetical protein
VDQSGYIRTILDCFSMADANPHPTPLPAGANLHLIKNTAQAIQAEVKHFQSLIGSLLYYMCKLALGQIFPLLYHIWHSMQQTLHYNIYTLLLMSCSIYWELLTSACAMMVPMALAFMAILIPVWVTRLITTTPPLAMCTCL